MVAIKVYSAVGEQLRTIEVEPSVFDSSIRRALLKEALIAYLASQRQGTHKTKNRAEVMGGNKKPFRQKGTGGARQGSIRSPQFRGGGHAHHKLPRDYHYTLPKEARRLATRSSLRYRLEQGAISVIEGLEGTMKEPATKAVAALLAKLGIPGKGALLISESNDTNLYLSARNLQKVDVSERRNITAGVILRRPNIIFTTLALDALLSDLASPVAAK